MRNLLLLALLVLAVYLLFRSGIPSRLLQGRADPSAAPELFVTVYPPVIESLSTPAQGNPASTTAATVALPTVTPLPAATPLPPPTIVVPEPPPTLSAQPTPTASSTFTITVETPHDGETLNVSPVLVIGQTQPNALVSVNDSVGFADAEGRFSIALPLQEGPNVLEVIASNAAGEQVFVILTVLYQP